MMIAAAPDCAGGNCAGVSDDVVRATGRRRAVDSLRRMPLPDWALTQEFVRQGHTPFQPRQHSIAPRTFFDVIADVKR